MRRFISYQDYLNREYGYSDRETAYSRDADDVQEETHTVPTGGSCASCPPAPETPAGADESDTGVPSPSRAPKRGQDDRHEVSAESGSSCPKRKTGWGSIVLLFLCFGIAVACAVMMSTGLSLEHLGIGGKATLPAYRVYCVQMAAPSTAEEAAKVAENTRQKGGGGYIYVTEGLYIVLASAYENEGDCDNVIEKLSLSKTDASKFIVNVPATTVADLKGNAKETAKSAYARLWQTYLDLYKLTVSLDNSAISTAAGRLSLGSIIERCKDSVSALGEITHSCGTKIKSTLSKTVTQLNMLYLEQGKDETLSRDIKYAYLKLLHDFASLQHDLSAA